MSSAPEQSLSAIETRLKAIKRADGYNTDAGYNVKQGELTIDPVSDDFPVITILSGDEDTEHLTGRSYRNEREFNIEGYTNDPDAPTAAILQLEADIKQAIEQADETLGGIVHYIDYRGSAEPQVAEDSGSVAGVRITYVVIYDRSYGA